jgi:hypothetical protein
MTKTELQTIVNDTAGIYTSEQKVKAQAALADLKNQPTEGFDSSAEMWAQLARRHADPERRAQWFSDFREKFKNDPIALRSFTPERENLRAKRNVYDQHGGDVIGQVFDDEIPQLLQEKGRGYYGTIAYYVERKGMTPEAAAVAASEHMERVHTNAIIDEGFRSGKLVRDCCKNSLQQLSMFATKEGTK